MSYRTFLELLCAEEIAHRAQMRISVMLTSCFGGS
jgi:hypothetical protein